MGNSVSAHIYETKVFRPNPHLKSMGNSVSAHIYETKVFRPYCYIV